MVLAAAALIGACASDPEKLTPTEWLEENTRLLEKLRSYDSEERIEAINAFKKVGRSRGTQYALAILLDPALEDPRTEVVLARILADWRDERAIPFLLAHLFRQDRGLTRIAEEGLVVFRDNPDLIEALSEKVKSPVPRDRKIAARVLAEVGGHRVVELFAERYKTETDSEVRAIFLIKIRESRHPRRREFLIDALTDPDGGLREFVWSVLEKEAKLPPDLEFDPYGDGAERADAVARLRMWNRRERSGR